MWRLPFGATVQEKGLVNFRVWAPFASSVEVLLNSNDKSESRHKMQIDSRGFYEATIPARAGDLYLYLLEGEKRRPDPASRFQPRGVHSESAVVDPDSFTWTDESWKGLEADKLFIYELHVGTFSGKGTFDGVAEYVDYLVKLGVTAVELMPVAQFSGSRNWGYDGVHPYSPQNTYGGVESLKSLVDRCHSAGLGVILDVVYNHLGPEGNYLGDFGPYFSYKYKTPWGPAINYDESGSDQVREFIVNNALYWVNEYHIDALRLDAIHGIFDNSTEHILQEIGTAVHAQSERLGKNLFVIAESDLNDPKTVTLVDRCGYGLDAQWSDDFHHSVHTYLTGERFGYYQDFGDLGDIAKSLSDVFVYDGRYSRYRGRRHGAKVTNREAKRFVFSMQNHDQVGNRADGRRLAALVDRKKIKLAAGLLILSPYVPLFFMGEEYGETNPFYYFTSHSDPALVEAVRAGRKKEFEIHEWRADPADPQDISTFRASVLNQTLLSDAHRSELFQHYSTLIRLRKTYKSLATDRSSTKVRLDEEQKAIIVKRSSPGEDVVLVYIMGQTPARLQAEPGKWSLVYDSENTSAHGLEGQWPAEFMPCSVSVLIRK